MEARYVAAWRAGDQSAAAGELVAFTSALLQQARAMLDALADDAARQLGLPGTPPDEQLLKMLDEAAELYAFEPTSDDPPPPSGRLGDKRLRQSVGACMRQGSSGSGSSSGAAGAQVLHLAHKSVTA